MMENTIKTGILSFGMSGKLFHSPFLNEHQGFELSAVVERTEKKAHLVYPEIKSYRSIDELLAEPHIELVVVNTPNATHFEFALNAIKAKKHVLIEKPFTVTSSQARQLFQEAQKYNCCVLPYQNRRYESDFLSVKSVLDSGKLGELIEVHLRYDRYRYALRPEIAKETPVPGSGLLYNLGPHLIDAAISLFGTPLQWKKSWGFFRPKTKVDDYAHIHLSYPKGMQVFITASLLVADPPPAFVLHGTKGSYIKHRTDVQEKQLLEGMRPENPSYGMEASDQCGTLTTISTDGEKTQEKITSVKSSYMHVFDDVYNMIRRGQAYPVSEKQIIQQLEILEG